MQEVIRKGETSSGHQKKLKGDLVMKQVAPDLNEKQRGAPYLNLKRAMIQGL